MYLKKIKILGFKSFADSTSLEFHPGITAIVGPNGCGKSNISDSFRWVLGEQSAKSMRGNKMHDVIFAGTSKRKPLNMAEVTITMADVGDTLKTDYDEVSVTRRVHRSGESDYLINKRPVRLRDVYDLFLDSGMGKNAFSIFEQGKIEQVINLSAMERRYIFEEAAGILRFLQRKKEALRRLQQTEANIERVRDIHQEVEKQIIVLERQAEQARVYKENKAVLESLEIGLAVARWNHFEKRMDSLQSKKKEKVEAHEAATLDLEKLDVERQNGNICLNQAMKELQTQKEEVFKTRSQKEIQTRQRQSQEDRIQEMAQKELEWKRELDEMIEKRKLRQIEASQTEEKQKSVEEELLGLEEVRHSQRDLLKSIELEVNQIRDTQHAVQQERMQLLQTENQIEGELKQNTLRQEHNREKESRLQKNQYSLKEHLAQLESEIQAKKGEVETASQYIETQKEQFALYGSQIDQITETIKGTQAELAGIHQEQAELKARQKALFRLRDEMEGFSKGTKRLIKENADVKSPLHGKLTVLYESLSADGKDEMAFSVVMKPYTQTLVVETLGDFHQVLAFAKEHSLHDYSLVCREMLPAQEKLSSHFLKHLITAQSLDEGLQVGEKDVWTKEGIYIDRNHVLFHPSEGEGNVFLREAELKSLDQKLEQSLQERAQREETLKGLNQQRSEVQARKTELDQLIRQAEVKLVEEKYAMERMLTDSEKTTHEIEKEQDELLALNELNQELKQVLSELNKKHAVHRLKVEERQEQVNTLSVQLQEKLESLKLQQIQMQDKESAYQKVAEEKRKIVHQLNVLEVKDLESLQQEKRLEEEIRSIQEKKAEIQLNRVDYEQKIEEIEQALKETLEQCATLEQAVNERRQQVEQIEGRLREKRGLIKKQESELHELSIQCTQVESSKHALEVEFTERFQMTMTQAQERAQELVESMEKTERQIRALRRKIEDAGNINMTSIEEFDKHKERYEFLNQQINDLSASKEELVQIITQLDSESRKVFKETFEQIQANFKKNFEILFRGGEADLQFTESGDILEAGIEIVAKPPGKKMRSINLMSGGEKCLTAVALLFAIFEVKPAPFCILDEIDAPLDDTNVERFLNVVKQFTDRCQFIIITHNKRTMAIADRLFGVSMQERGVSKLLSMEFSKEESVEPVLV